MAKLLALDHRAVSGSRFPSTGIVDPGVAADDGSGPMLALDFRIVSERVVRHGGVRAEGHNLQVGEVPALPLACLALQVLYELVPCLPQVGWKKPRQCLMRRQTVCPAVKG